MSIARPGPMSDGGCHDLQCREDEAAFIAWTRSEAFHRTHANAGAVGSEAMTIGHPAFESCTTLQTIGKAGRTVE